MMIRPTERMIAVPGAELCVETFGAADAPAVLLIMGASSSMLWWPEALCEQVAARGRFVIRYDHRDTGRSTTYPPGEPGYTMDDLAGDALGVLDALGVRAAVVVGMSLGGTLAQILALRAPDRVRGLVLIGSKPLGPADPAIPGIAPELLAYFGETPDYTDRAAVIAHAVGEWRLLAGPARPFDEAAVTARAARDFDRAVQPESAGNHGQLTGAAAYAGQPIRKPTIVIHGTHDPMLRIEHGRALAAELAARLIVLDGAGHEIHPLDFPAIVAAITGVA